MGTIKGYKMYVSYAVYAAELVLPIYEKKYPNDDRPRKAIEAAKKRIKDKSADAAADAAAADAAYAAAAYAAAADAAYAAAYAAADAAKKKEMQLKILKQGLEILKEGL